MPALRLTQRQRTFMVAEVTERAARKIEECTGDMGRCDDPGKLLKMHSELGPYVGLVRELRGTHGVQSVGLLRACACKALEEYRHSLQHEEDGLERLLSGEWDYCGDGSDEERLEIEQNTRRTIDEYRGHVGVAAGVLLRAEDNSVAVAA